MNKARVDYWVDVAMGVAGASSAVTGLVLLLPPTAAAEILGISVRAWSSLHTWGSLAAVSGVGVHLALHWKWLVAMTRQVLGTGKAVRTSAAVGQPVPAATTASARAVAPMGRRAFLAVGGVLAVATGLASAGYKALAGGEAVPDRSGSGAAAGTLQTGGVACRFGLVNDPYPGQCRHFVDWDGDGVCDYSVPGSGGVAAGNGQRSEGRKP